MLARGGNGGNGCGGNGAHAGAQTHAGRSHGAPLPKFWQKDGRLRDDSD